MGKKRRGLKKTLHIIKKVEAGLADLPEDKMANLKEFLNSKESEAPAEDDETEETQQLIQSDEDSTKPVVDKFKEVLNLPKEEMMAQLKKLWIKLKKRRGLKKTLHIIKKVEAGLADLPEEKMANLKEFLNSKES